MKKYFFVLMIATMIFASSFLAVRADTKSSAVDTKKIDAFVLNEMKTAHIPGLALGIVNHNQIVYLKGYGKADQTGRAVTPQTPFIIGSMSKSFTGLAIMQLVEKGKLNLDTPVQHYLPWFRLADVNASRLITIRDLLGHISGIPTLASTDIYNEPVDLSLEQLIRRQSDLKNSKQIIFRYSNLNYLILGEIVQNVSEMLYEKFIAQNVLQPLDMKHSFTSRAEAQKAGLATGYQPVFGFMLPTNPPFHPAFIPGGYFISSAEDMAHYLIAQIEDGSYKGISILSPEGVRKMHSPIAPSAPYGTGWFIPSPFFVDHSGSTENFNSDMKIIRQQGWGIVVLCNSTDTLAQVNLDCGVKNISGGIANMLLGYKLIPIKDLSRINLMYLIIDILVVGIVLLLIWILFRLPHWKAAISKSKQSLSTRILLLVIFYLLIPFGLWISILAQGLEGLWGTWKLNFLFYPGLAHFLFTAPLIFMGIGVVKIVMIMMVRSKKNTLVVSGEWR